MLANIRSVYGYVSTMGGAVNAGDSISWNFMPPRLGFISSSSFDNIQGQEQYGIHLFIHCLLKDYENLPGDQDDLNDRNFISLSLLFHWQHVIYTLNGLFVFHTPASSACNWSLGIKSASVAVYICQLIVSNSMFHTILTVAHHLLSQYIPFQTLLHGQSSSSDVPLSSSYTPVSFQKERYQFTKLDFKSAMLHSKAVLRGEEAVQLYYVEAFSVILHRNF